MCSGMLHICAKTVLIYRFLRHVLHDRAFFGMIRPSKFPKTKHSVIPRSERIPL